MYLFAQDLNIMLKYELCDEGIRKNWVRYGANWKFIL